MEYGEGPHETCCGCQELERIEVKQYKIRVVRNQEECMECWLMRVNSVVLVAMKEGGCREWDLEIVDFTGRWQCDLQWERSAGGKGCNNVNRAERWRYGIWGKVNWGEESR